MNEIALLITIWILPIALLIGTLLAGLEALYNYFKGPDLEKVVKQVRKTKIDFKFIEPEMSHKTRTRKKKHRDRKGYKKPE